MDEFDPSIPGCMHFLGLFGGKYRGKDGLGVMAIEFPNMESAASWVSTYDYGTRAFLRDSGTGKSFADTVTISLYPKEYA
jgi:hypothetical protein